MSKMTFDLSDQSDLYGLRNVIMHVLVEDRIFSRMPRLYRSSENLITEVDPGDVADIVMDALRRNWVEPGMAREDAAESAPPSHPRRMRWPQSIKL